MRLVIQRVCQAKVSVEGAVVGQIGKGLCVLVGITDGDDITDVEWCKNQILTTKFWPDDNEKQWKRDLKSSADLQVLLVSQFTLYGKVYKKGKLDFHHAMSPDPAKEVYQSLIDIVRNEIGEDRTHSGQFGAYMEVDITNDGPVTVILDSPTKPSP